MNSVFDLLQETAAEAGWSQESQIVVLCKYLDGLHALISQSVGVDTLPAFRDFLDRQVAEERSYDEPGGDPT